MRKYSVFQKLAHSLVAVKASKNSVLRGAVVEGRYTTNEHCI
jgi:hypothetical protein